MLQLSNVKPEQMKAVKGIIEQDVCIVLPTGYGKRACFQSLPLVYDQLLPESDLCFITEHTQWGIHMHSCSCCNVCSLTIYFSLRDNYDVIESMVS